MFTLTVLTPFVFAGAVGFSHAFEADHLIAVSSIVSRRDRILHAVRDGIFWGLGHTSTIFLIGMIMIVGGITIPEEGFQGLEGAVGLMLVALGVFRMWKGGRMTKSANDAPHHHHPHKASLAYGVGLVHGLAGSGALILLVMTEIKGTASMMTYLAIFGVGSILGMMVAAGLFSLPITRSFAHKNLLKNMAVILSSTLCILYGGWLALTSFGII